MLLVTTVTCLWSQRSGFCTRRIVTHLRPTLTTNQDLVPKKKICFSFRGLRHKKPFAKLQNHHQPKSPTHNGMVLMNVFIGQSFLMMLLIQGSDSCCHPQQRRWHLWQRRCHLPRVTAVDVFPGDGLTYPPKTVALQPFNIVMLRWPHNHNIFSLLLNCSSATVMNHNAKKKKSAFSNGFRWHLWKGPRSFVR